MNALTTLSRSRRFEAEADKEGIAYAFAAGYDPRGLTQFFQNLGGSDRGRLESYFATHPTPLDRIRAADEDERVRQSLPETRKTVVAQYERRGFAGMAARTRNGRDPFAITPLPLRFGIYEDERGSVNRNIHAVQEGMRRAFPTARAGGIAQTLLLVNYRFDDARWLYLAYRAYVVQSAVQDVQSQIYRAGRVAPVTLNNLTRYDTEDAPPCRVGDLRRVGDFARRGSAFVAGVHAFRRRSAGTERPSFTNCTGTRHGFDMPDWRPSCGFRKANSPAPKNARVRHGGNWRLPEFAFIACGWPRLWPPDDTARTRLFRELAQRRLGLDVPVSTDAGRAAVGAVLRARGVFGDSSEDLYIRLAKSPRRRKIRQRYCVCCCWMWNERQPRKPNNPVGNTFCPSAPIRFLLLFCAAIGLCAALLSCANRGRTEQANRTVEIALDYAEVRAMAANAGISRLELLKQFRQNGGSFSDRGRRNGERFGAESPFGHR